MILSLMLIAITGCMGDSNCNYDGVCQDDEPNSCGDCKDVLGRGVDVDPAIQGNVIWNSE